MRNAVFALASILLLGLFVSGCSSNDVLEGTTSTSTSTTIESLDLSADLDDLESDENFSINLDELDW